MKSGFGQFCPIAVACEVFAERWTPLILRELLAGSEQFNELHRGIPLISRPLLARRLRQLEAAGVVRKEPLPARRGHRYRLTEAGSEFRSVLDALGTWGQRWTVRVTRANLDPSNLMWNMRRRIALEHLPPRRIVVQFRFRGVPSTYHGPRTFWLILDPTQADVCIEDPGFEVDLHLDADLATLAKVWLGDQSFESALLSKDVQVMGPRDLVGLFPSLMKWSRFVAVPRPAAAGPLHS